MWKLFRKRTGIDAHSSSDEEAEEVPELLRRSTDDGSYNSSSSLESTTPSTRRKFSQVYDDFIKAKLCYLHDLVAGRR